MEGINLIARRTWGVPPGKPFRIDVPIPVKGRDPCIMPGDHIVHSGLPLLPHRAVPWINAREPHIRLESSNTNLIRYQIQAVHRPRVAIERAEAAAADARTQIVGKRARAIVGPVALKLSVEGEHAHVIRQHFFHQHIDGCPGKIRHIPRRGVPRPILLVLHTGPDRRNISRRAIVRPGRVIARIHLIIQQIPL